MASRPKRVNQRDSKLSYEMEASGHSQSKVVPKPCNRIALKEATRIVCVPLTSNAIMLFAKLMPCGVEEGTIFCAIFAQPVHCELLNQLQNLASVKNALDVIW